MIWKSFIESRLNNQLKDKSTLGYNTNFETIIQLE